MNAQQDDTSFCALIVIGVSASGKSTIGRQLAERLHWTFKDGDDLHPAGNVEKMHAGKPLTDEDRWPWLRAIATDIDQHRRRGESLIVACSALKRSYRDMLTDGPADVRIVYLRGERALIESRMAGRKGHFMPPGLLDSQFDALEEPAASERAIVVDVSAPIDDVVERIADRVVQDREVAP